MIRGARHWDDRSRYYVQTNNAIEELLRKSGQKLESCGPTAAINCLAVLGYDLTVTCPGPWRPQPEDILLDYLNDPRNAEKFRGIRTDVDQLPGNRVPQYYPLAVGEVFGARCDFAWLHSFGGLSDYLIKGYAIQICLKSPGHYLAAIAFDDESGEIIYNDPWPGRLGGDGFNIRMGSDEYEKNIQPFALIYVGGAA